MMPRNTAKQAAEWTSADTAGDQARGDAQLIGKRRRPGRQRPPESPSSSARESPPRQQRQLRSGKVAGQGEKYGPFPKYCGTSWPTNSHENQTMHAWGHSHAEDSRLGLATPAWRGRRKSKWAIHGRNCPAPYCPAIPARKSGNSANGSTNRLHPRARSPVPLARWTVLGADPAKAQANHLQKQGEEDKALAIVARCGHLESGTDGPGLRQSHRPLSCADHRQRSRRPPVRRGGARSQGIPAERPSHHGVDDLAQRRWTSWPAPRPAPCWCGTWQAAPAPPR